MKIHCFKVDLKNTINQLDVLFDYISQKYKTNNILGQRKREFIETWNNYFRETNSFNGIFLREYNTCFKVTYTSDGRKLIDENHIMSSDYDNVPIIDIFDYCKVKKGNKRSW